MDRHSRHQIENGPCLLFLMLFHFYRASEFDIENPLDNAVFEYLKLLEYSCYNL